MAKTHDEYVAEIIGGRIEVHCCAPGCDEAMAIDVASHVDLREIEHLGAWSTVTLASLEATEAFFCPEHQRVLAKACPGIQFQALDRSIQFLAQHRYTQAVKAEERAAEEMRRQEQAAAEAAKVEAMRAFAHGKFDPKAAPPTNGHGANGSGCRQQVLGDSVAARVRRRMTTG